MMLFIGKGVLFTRKERGSLPLLSIAKDLCPHRRDLAARLLNR